MFSLENKVAFVTGGNGGIGLGMAKGFLEQGASVVLAARTRSKLDSAVTEITEAGAGDRVLAAECDVKDRESIQEALDASVEKFGGIDIVVNNAGTNKRADEPHLLSESDWQDVIDTNITSMHSVTSLAFPIIKTRGGGKIINIGSILGEVAGGKLRVPGYAAAKGGLHNLTRELASQWGRKGVRVNAIAPGWFETEMNDEMFRDGGGQAYMETGAAMGRPGREGELDGAMLYLASDASSFVTGHILEVSGGWTAS